MVSAEKSLWVVAGEPSGDTHTAHLVRALHAQDPSITWRGYGGPKMAAAGVDVIEDLASDAIMGIFPVIKAFPRIKRLFDQAVAELRERRPSALVLTDYPGFNLRLAARAHELGIPVIYYISPQVWAWARWRIKKIARTVDLMLVILPFEAKVYENAGIDARFVGHPLMDHLRSITVDQAEVTRLKQDASPLVGIFPGSREHVVRSLLPTFLATARNLSKRPGFENARFVIAVAQPRFESIVAEHDTSDLPLEVLTERPYEVMEASDLIMTTSGTTTLEVAASGTPFALAYKVSPVFYAIGRLVVAVEHIGLVNLVAGRTVVPEHIGFRDFSPALADDLDRLWNDKAARNEQIAGLKAVADKLDQHGSYDRTAEAIVSFLDERTPSTSN